MTVPDTGWLIPGMSNTCARLNTRAQEWTLMEYTSSLWKHGQRHNRELQGDGISCEREEGSSNTTKGTSWMASSRWGRCVSLCVGSHQHHWDIDGPDSNPMETLGNPSYASCPLFLTPSLVALVPGLLCCLFAQLIQLIKVAKDVSNKESVEICHFLPFYSSGSAHTDIGSAVQPPKGRCRTAGLCCLAVPWIVTPLQNLPIVVCDGYMVKYFTSFQTQTQQWHLY